MDHVTESNHPIVINNAVEKMQINILVGLHHSAHNDDPSEQHKFCMNKNVKWCKYKNELGSSLASTSHSKHKKSKLLHHFCLICNHSTNDCQKLNCSKGVLWVTHKTKMKHSMLHFGEGVRKRKTLEQWQCSAFGKPKHERFIMIMLLLTQA